MKARTDFFPPRRLITIALVIFSGTAGLLPQRANAQEENLKTALETQDRRKQGLKELQDKVQNFFFLKFARDLVEKLEKRDREVDPFGMAMDPEHELAMPVVEATEEEGDEKVKTSLEEALSKFHVTGVFPSRREVMIGAQTLGVGDQLVIKHQGAEFHMEIADIDTKEVRLRDTDTGEKATVPHGVVAGLPAGMLREKPKYAEEDDLSKKGTIVPMTKHLITLE